MPATKTHNGKAVGMFPAGTALSVYGAGAVDLYRRLGSPPPASLTPLATVTSGADSTHAVSLVPGHYAYYGLVGGKPQYVGFRIV